MSTKSEFERKTDLLKQFARYPFREVLVKGEESDGPSQIIGVNYAAQTVLLRSYIEYDPGDLIFYAKIENEQ